MQTETRTFRQISKILLCHCFAIHAISKVWNIFSTEIQDDGYDVNQV